MSDDRKTLTLTKPWGRYKARTKLTVLLPHEDPAPGTVDPQRAAQLVTDKLASWDKPATAQDAAASAPNVEDKPPASDPGGKATPTEEKE